MRRRESAIIATGAICDVSGVPLTVYPATHPFGLATLFLGGMMAAVFMVVEEHPEQIGCPHCDAKFSSLREREEHACKGIKTFRRAIRTVSRFARRS